VRPLEAGWYGGVLTCFTPFFVRNYLNSLIGEVSGIVRNSPGNPEDTNDFLMHEMVVVNDDDEVACTSTIWNACQSSGGTCCHKKGCIVNMDSQPWFVWPGPRI